MDIGKHPVLVREVCEHLMKLILQKDWLARYVATGTMYIPSLAGVPIPVADEIRKLEPVSCCRTCVFRMVPLIRLDSHPVLCEHGSGRRTENQVANTHCPS